MNREGEIVATTYRSKIDAWLIAVFAVLIGASVYTSAKIVLAGAPIAWLPLGLSVIVGVALPLWLLQSTRYTLEPGRLLVRSGPFSWRVPVADIRNVTPTSNPLSSPALSFDRLRIEYGDHRTLMISPRNKEHFLRELEALRRGAT